tara:strand:- start:3793 stop:6936 length:3144 start_codon:yes stop_codon:yes gene_type:complete
MAEIIVGAGRTKVRSVTKVVVPGNRTIVKKVVVGTPTKVGLAAQGFLVNLSDVNGSVNKADGTFLRFDSATSKYKHTTLSQALGQNVTITNTGDFASLAFDSVGGDFEFTGVTAANIKSVLSARKDSNNAGDGDLAFDSATGTILYTGPFTRKLVSAAVLGNDSTDFTYDSATGIFQFKDSNFGRTDFRSVYHQGLTIPDGQTIRFGNPTQHSTIRESNNNLEIENNYGAINIVPRNGDRLVVKSGNNISGGQSLIIAGDSNGVILNYKDGTQRLITTDSGVTISGNIFVDSNALVDGTLTVRQGVTLQSTLDVTDSSRIRDNLTVDSNLNVGGNITLTGTLTGSINAANVREHFSSGGDLTYDSSTGKFSIDVEQIYTAANFDSDFRVRLTTTNTDSIAEGNNLYYTVARADSAAKHAISVTDVGGDGSLSYNSTNGIITYTGPSAAEVRAHFSTGASLTYNNATGVFTTNQDLDSTSDVKFRNITQTGYLAGPAEFIIDPAAIGDNTGTVKILGNLQVEGSQLIVNSTTVSINDKNLVLADSAADSSQMHGAGLTIGGTNIGNKPIISYSHPQASWSFNRPLIASSFTGNVVGQVSDISNLSTDSLAEGSTNKYYTQARTDSDAKHAIGFVDNGGDGSLTYSSDTGLITYTGPSSAEVRAHFSSVDAGGDGSFTYDSSTGIMSYSGPTPAEVRAHFSAGGDLTYDSATGKFEFNVESVYTKANFDSDLGLANTGQLPEGSNKYYTKVRVDSDITASLNDSFNTVNITINNTITDTVDSAYVLGRITEAPFLDSADAIGLIDSAYVQARSPLQDFSYGVITGTPNVLDSADTRNIFSGTGPGFSYDSAKGQFTFAPGASYSSTNFDSDLNAANTDSLSEGSTNLYFTNERAQDAVAGAFTHSNHGNITAVYNDSANEIRLTAAPPYADSDARHAISVTDVGGDGSLSYNSTTGAISYNGPSDAEWFNHLENAASLGEVSYDSINKFKITSAFFTSKPTASSLDLDSDKILILDATDGLIKQSNIGTLASAAAGVGNTAKLLAFIGL